jgi:hypothetical protein
MLLLMITVPAFGITQEQIDMINAELEKIAVIPKETENTTEPSQYNPLKGQFDPWTKEDTYWQIAATLVMMLDLEQTRIALTEQNNNKETSQLVIFFTGSYPKYDEIEKLAYTWFIINPFLAYILPSNLRRMLQMSMITIPVTDMAKSDGIEVRLKMIFSY